MTGDPSLDAPDERRLVAAVLGGDEAAFRTLYRTHAGAMYRTALRMSGGSEADAADTTQEAWRRALKGLGGFRFRAPLASWLRGIVVRCALESLRARDRFPGSTPPDALAAAPPPDAAARLDLGRAFEALPDGYRTVLLLHDVEGHTHADIARMLDIQEGTSKSQLSRARAWMRKALAPEEP